jgi:hypothetical protein
LVTSRGKNKFLIRDVAKSVSVLIIRKVFR